jgi:hypothetical protein
MTVFISFSPLESAQWGYAKPVIGFLPNIDEVLSQLQVVNSLSFALP